MVNPTDVLGNGKLNKLVDINFGCICIWETRYHVIFFYNKKKRSFESIDVQDNILNLMAIGEHADFFGLSFVNRGNYLNFKKIKANIAILIFIMENKKNFYQQNIF